MQAVRRFMIHIRADGPVVPGYGPGTHNIARGTEIPEEMVPLINNQAVVNEPLPHLVEEAEARGIEPPTVPEYSEYQDLKTVEDVLNWCFAPEDPGERLKRAMYAEERDMEGKQRATLLTQLDDYITTVGGRA